MEKEFKPIVKETAQSTTNNSKDDSFLANGSPLHGTPVFTPETVANLPNIFYDGCKVFSTIRERDVFLTGSFSVLSSCFKTLFGLYDRVYVGPNLFSFVVAPASSGKGALTWSKALGYEYHKYLLEENKKAEDKYQDDLKSYEDSKKDGQTELQKPEPPPHLQLFIPGDISAASIISIIHQNSGRGLIFETEADTLSGTLSREWGNFSHILRKAFHHESISYQRKSQKEFIEIEKSHISIALSGTPGQVIRLIPSAEDGLFSRFIYYAFYAEPDWRDVSPSDGRPILNDHFSNLSGYVKEMVLAFEKEEKILFELLPNHWKKLNQTFKYWLDLISILVGEDASSVVKRLGLITFRLAMILSAVRNYENGVISSVIRCKDIDFDTALSLAETYKSHAITMYSSLPKSANGQLKGLIKTFYEDLPFEFKREQIVIIAEKHGIAERTLTKYLNKIKDCNLLVNYRQGCYRKIIQK